MAQFLLDLSPIFPQPPKNLPPEVAQWFQQLQDTIDSQYRVLADRVESLVMTDTIANRPTANGTFRFYLSSDESPPVMYFDDGTWRALNAT